MPDVPAFDDAAIKAAVQSILGAGGNDFDVPAKLAVEFITDGILIDAWAALSGGAEAATGAFTGLVLKQKLAWLLAAAVAGAEGALRLAADRAQLTGKSLHKQAEKVQRAIKEISSKAERARAAATKAATGSPSELAASHTREQSDIDTLRSRRSATVVSFQQQLLSAEPEPDAAMIAADSVVDAEPLSPGATWLQSYEAEQAAAKQSYEEERAERVAAVLAQHGGIPRALARELGEDGCAAVLKFLNLNGGDIGLAPDVQGAGAFCVRSATGSPTSLTWEQALRHQLPFILRDFAELTWNAETALEAKIDAYQSCVQELEHIVETSRTRHLQMLDAMGSLIKQNGEMRKALGL